MFHPQGPTDKMLNTGAEFDPPSILAVVCVANWIAVVSQSPVDTPCPGDSRTPRCATPVRRSLETFLVRKILPSQQHVVRKASLLGHRRDTFNDDSIDRNLRDHVFASEARIAQNLRWSFGHTGVWSPHAIRSSDQTDNVGGESHTNR